MVGCTFNPQVKLLADLRPAQVSTNRFGHHFEKPRKGPNLIHLFCVSNLALEMAEGSSKLGPLCWQPLDTGDAKSSTLGLFDIQLSLYHGGL